MAGRSKHDVEFLGTALRSTMSGQSAAMGYRFRVDRGQEVVVWVVSLPAQYSREEVERAAGLLIRMKLDEGAEPASISELMLDGPAMAGVVRHPEWRAKG